MRGSCRAAQSKAPSESTAPEPQKKKQKKRSHACVEEKHPQYPLQQINLDGTHRSSFRKIAKSHRSGSRKRTKTENKSATPSPTPPPAAAAGTAQTASSQFSDNPKRKKKLMAGWNEQVPDRPQTVRPQSSRPRSVRPARADAGERAARPRLKRGARLRGSVARDGDAPTTPLKSAASSLLRRLQA